MLTFLQCQIAVSFLYVTDMVNINVVIVFASKFHLLKESFPPAQIALENK